MHAEERGWTTYRVAKNAGIPQSSRMTWYSKQINPPLDAIEKMCIAFDISLSDFFYEKKEDQPETNLEKIRKQTGMSREELAKIADVPVDIICAYEHRERDLGKAPYRTVERMAKALKCPLDKLVEE